MDFQKYEPYRALILRLFLGLTVLFWGYEKLTLEKLTGSYTMDYEAFMVIDVNQFLMLAGWGQVLMGVLLIVGLLTRLNAAILTFMGIITILIPGFLIIKDVPHFAYAFALTGAALALLIEGGGKQSLDRKLFPKT